MFKMFKCSKSLFKSVCMYRNKSKCKDLKCNEGGDYIESII